MVRNWRAAGILRHIGYTIGFLHDTPASVREDLRRLRQEIEVDQVPFFMLMPLPGSRDHQELTARGEPIEADLNRDDSCHPTMPHPRMRPEAWSGLYPEAWQDFYSVSNMKAAPARPAPRNRGMLLRNFLWYSHSVFIEHTHPMLCGLVRLKPRTQRRTGYAVESRVQHLWRQTGDTARWLRGTLALCAQMQGVWLDTRVRRPAGQGRHRPSPLALAGTVVRETWWLLRSGLALRSSR